MNFFQSGAMSFSFRLSKDNKGLLGQSPGPICHLKTIYNFLNIL